MRRTVLLAVTAAVAAVTLAACGGQTSTPSTTTSAPASPSGAGVTVVVEVDGTGTSTADVVWTGSTHGTPVLDAPLPYRDTETLTGPKLLMFSATASTGQVTCRMTHNGSDRGVTGSGDSGNGICSLSLWLP
jgi:hypothetical protein